MTASPTRRQLAKGAAWAAPAVLATAAVPAYAASQRNPSLDGLYGDTSFNYSGGRTDTINGRCRTEIQFTSNNLYRDGRFSGFTIYYVPDGEPTTATIDKLEYFFVVPTGLITTGEMVLIGESSQTWRADGLYSGTVGGFNGEQLSSSQFDIFKFTFTGNHSGYEVRAQGTQVPLTGSLITAVSSGNSSCVSSGQRVPICAGYFSSYTLENGAMTSRGIPFENLSSITGDYIRF